MIPTATDWIEEARLRLDDARVLLRRNRPSRAVSAAYYALPAAGKGALLAEGVAIDTHTALYKQLSKHFVRHGHLPDATAALIRNLYEERLAADYDLRFFSDDDVESSLEQVESLVDRLATLV